MNTFRTAYLGKRYLIFCTQGIGWLRPLTAELSQTRSLWNRFVHPRLYGGVISSRWFSKHSNSTPASHDVDDDHPESTEVLHKLRARHHYHHDKDAGKLHEVFVLEPNFKWGKNRFRTVTSEHRLDEACALVESIENWKVAGKSIESVRKLDGKTFFGKGKIEQLTEKFQEMKNSSAPFDSVFIDVAQLNTRQHKELEDLWGLKIFDRFGVVLQIFKERAKSAEAKIQVELAELPYIRYYTLYIFTFISLSTSPPLPPSPYKIHILKDILEIEHNKSVLSQAAHIAKAYPEFRVMVETVTLRIGVETTAG